MKIDHLILVSQTELVPFEEVQRVASALQVQLSNHLPRFWGVTAAITPARKVEETPRGAAPILIREQINASSGTFGLHKVEPNSLNTSEDDQPYAVVKYTKDVWSFDASHEALEMVLDPTGNSMHRAPSPDGGREVDYLIEICDPCGRNERAGYTIGDVLVSDFVTPAYYRPGQSGSRLLTSQGGITVPLTLLPGGYLVWSELSPSGLTGAGDWYMWIHGQDAVQIPKPDIYYSRREQVDRHSGRVLSDFNKRRATINSLKKVKKKGDRIFRENKKIQVAFTKALMAQIRQNSPVI